MPAEVKWIVQDGAADPTSGSLRMDATRASLRKSEGHACHARRSEMDSPRWRSGPDKRVPPNGRDEGIPARGGGVCLSCPPK
jgi:hypothetical protein